MRHASITQWEELGQADGVLGHQRLEGVVPSGRFVPVADAGPRGQYPRLASRVSALSDGGGQVVLGVDG